jgi:thiamine kinase-like enzyme
MTNGLHRALARLGWTLIACAKVQGGYAAQVYRVQVLTAQGKVRNAIYKRFAPHRDQELALYERIVPELPHGVPTLYAVVDEPDERGMLMEAAGEVLKPTFRKRDREGQRHMLAQILALLADLHVSMEEKASLWLREGKTTEYPFHSSEAWAAEAMQEMASQLDEKALAEMRHIAYAFYPRYRELAVGRWTFTHGDPHMENILLNKGQIRLIDWEWASIGLPQRDLAILLQDVLDRELHAFAFHTFAQELKKRGWAFDEAQFRTGFAASMLDNTIMMLGWEIGKYRNGHLDKAELDRIVDIKLGWIRECARQLKIQ